MVTDVDRGGRRLAGDPGTPLETFGDRPFRHAPHVDRGAGRLAGDPPGAPLETFGDCSFRHAPYVDLGAGGVADERPEASLAWERSAERLGLG